MSLVPTRQPQAVVRAKVSAPTSISNHARSPPTPHAATVRHGPLQAIEAPTEIASLGTGKEIRARFSPPRGAMVSIVPTMLMRPVNMGYSTRS